MSAAATELNGLSTSNAPVPSVDGYLGIVILERKANPDFTATKEKG
jgi:hypothetical protein